MSSISGPGKYGSSQTSSWMEVKGVSGCYPAHRDPLWRPSSPGMKTPNERCHPFVGGGGSGGGLPSFCRPATACRPSTFSASLPGALRTARAGSDRSSGFRGPSASAAAWPATSPPSGGGRPAGIFGVSQDRVEALGVPADKVFAHRLPLGFAPGRSSNSSSLLSSALPISLMLRASLPLRLRSVQRATSNSNSSPEWLGWH